MRRRASSAFDARAAGCRLLGQFALPLCKLTRLELQVAEGAAALIGLSPLQLPLQRSQPLEGPAAPGTGLPRILPPQIAGGAAHLLGCFAELRPLARRLPLGALGTAGSRDAWPLASLRLPLGLLTARAGLLLSALASLGLLSGLLLAHLPRQLFGLLPQLRLLAREPLEAALQFVRAQALALSGKVFLLPRELLLPPRQLAHAVERAVAAAVLTFLRALLRLVVGLLLPLQLAIEQGREILLRAVGPTGPRPVCLLPHDLTALDFRLRAQQVVQCFHFRGQRLGGLHGVECGLRAAHRCRGAGQRVLRGGADRIALHDARSAPWIAHLCGRTLGPFLQLPLRTADRPHVLGRTARAGAAIQLPRRHDDVLLGGDEIVERSIAASAAARLALCRRELLFERLHLEEEDVAARLGGSPAAGDVAHASVIGHEVAGLHPELLEVQRVSPGDGQRRPLPFKRHRLLTGAADAVHEIERTDAVVVVGARLDGDFLEGGDLPIARQDAGCGRPEADRSTRG